MKRTIGILGGIGPESSAKFYQSLIDKLQKRNFIKANEDYPHIILNSIPAPELVNHTDLKTYIEGVRTLEKAGAEFIVIVCNTVHLYFKELENSVKIPIINLKEEMRTHLENKKPQEFLILGSRRSIDSNLLGFEGINMADDDKDRIDQIILSYNAGKDKEVQKSTINKMIKKYKAKTLVVACTELSSLLKDITTSKIDTMDILLEATIREWQNS
jgi:aspartate racemase